MALLRDVFRGPETRLSPSHSNPGAAGFWSKVLSFPAMLVVALITSPFIASVEIQQGGGVMKDPDIWWHLRNAQVLLSTHHFIRQDFYSFTTHGEPWINAEWLAEIPYYLGFRFLGERGLFLVMLVAIELIVAGMLLLCYRRCNDIKAAFLATWVAVLFAAINFGLRTILFGWLCFLVEMLLLDAFRKGRDLLWLLPPLFLIWINLHGSWVFGYAFLCLFIAAGLVDGRWGCIHAVRWLRPELVRLAVIGGLSGIVLLLNPYGWRLVAYPFELISRFSLGVSVADEFQSVDFHTFHGKLVFVVVAGMFLATLVRQRSWPLHEVLFGLFATYTALTHRRFLFLAGMVLCPMLSVELAGLVFAPYDEKRNKRFLNVLFMAGYCTFAVLHIPSSRELRAAEPNYFPQRALPELERCCTQRHLFNSYYLGGYLIWNAPKVPIFIDTRGDIFASHGVLSDYLNAMDLHDSLAILDKYQIEAVLLPPSAALVYLLKHTPGWHVQFEDATATLLIRSAP